MKTDKIEIEKLLADGETVQLSPIGYSMYPLFVPERDMVRIIYSDGSRLKRGDVALYRREGSILVLHRVWKRKGDSFFFVGDNQKEIEGPLSREQIRGKMIGFERKGKYISVQNPVYRLLSGIWLWMRPVRPAVSALVHGMKVLLSKKRPGRRDGKKKRF